jgi:hypothetical protein
MPVQRGGSGAKCRGVPFFHAAHPKVPRQLLPEGDVEVLSDPRTKLAGIFNILSGAASGA